MWLKILILPIDKQTKKNWSAPVLLKNVCFLRKNENEFHFLHDFYIAITCCDETRYNFSNDMCVYANVKRIIVCEGDSITLELAS